MVPAWVVQEARDSTSTEWSSNIFRRTLAVERSPDHRDHDWLIECESLTSEAFEATFTAKVFAATETNLGVKI